MWPFFRALCVSLIACGCLEAQDEKVEEGHSYHGHVFNEGPRQAAVLIPGTGQVHFPMTTASESARQFFDQGIGQLHGYWDFEAERSFRQVAMIDPDCAMAYWGMAMANIKNLPRAKGFIEEALKRREQASERERMFIDGLAPYFIDTDKDLKDRRKDLTASLKKITERYPDDIEAKAFLMRQLYQNSRKGVPYESAESVDKIAREIFEKNPDHPVHHYVIHLWDHKKPANALDSSADCGPSSPAIAHMWHMPGHIYDKLRRYREAAWYQEASARVDHAHTIKFQFLPDQIHNFQHNNAWLVKTLSHLGRCDDSISLAKNMIELPRVPKFKKKGDSSSYTSSKSSWQSGRQRLVEVLVRFERWDQWQALESTPYLLPDDRTLMSRDISRFSAIARFETGDFSGGSNILAKLEKQLADEKAKEKKSDKIVADLQSVVHEVNLYQILNTDSPDQDKAKTLVTKLKNIPKPRHAYLYSRVGDHEKAVEMIQQAVKSGVNQVQPLAMEVLILRRAGEIEKSKESFEKLRLTAADADKDLAALRRLEPIVKEFGYTDVWQRNLVAAVDRDLDELGPFRWTPPHAPDFLLQNDCGVETRLSSREGRNTLVIFYLGKGCTHCMEQLNAFAPMLSRYREKGIDIVAISSDTPQGLSETFAISGDGAGTNPFPFPLLSDSNMEIFKKYRAFDDFENQPLHGTFLIDSKQRIRWQDISYEPFMYPDWLLEECERLLAIE